MKAGEHPPPATPVGDEEAAHAAALAGLPGMTRARLTKILDGLAPTLAWRAMAAGVHPADPERRFQAVACSMDVAEVGRRYADARVSILVRDAGGYPARLVGDRGQPAVLFARGDPSVADRGPSVALVGTRSATPYGRRVAADLAGDLSHAGVAVISGLAEGIDGAAHAGVVRRPDRRGVPVAVVGTGLDVVYPRHQAELWSAVAAAGAVFSEAPLGTLPLPRVFPARNRIIAGLSDVVVVVECHSRGGSLYTADAAASRGIPVGAVPGSVRSRASTGCNALIAEGCFPVLDATDVLVAIDLARCDPVTSRGATSSATDHAKNGLRTRVADRCGSTAGAGAGSVGVLAATEEQRRVLDAVDDHPTGLETILLRTGLSIAAIALACEELVARDLLVTGPGWWSRA